MTIDIISREQWGAIQAKSRSTITTPSPELWLHHTAGDHRGAAGVRRIQQFHMAAKPAGRGWSDIAYSFLIDRFTLQIFEGRGAGVLGSHTYGRNSRSHAICIMGDFEKDTPSPPLLDRIAELVRHGHERRWWPAALTGGHRDVASTACPGRNLYARIGDINRRAGAEPQMPTPNNGPSEYDKRVQTALLQIDPNSLPEFGADGFIGAESAEAAERIAERWIEQRVMVSELRTRLQHTEQKLAENERLAEAAELIRQGIIRLEP